jgi:hypothetical protein
MSIMKKKAKEEEEEEEEEEKKNERIMTKVIMRQNHNLTFHFHSLHHS